MLPALALLICIGFVLFLLRLDCKHSRDVTRAAWITTIWMAYAASRSLAQWFGSYSTDPEIASPIDRTLSILLLIIALRLVIRREFPWTNTIKDNAPLIVLLGFMLVSILWSNIPFIAFKRLIKEILAFIMGMVLLTEKDPRQAIQSVLRRTIYILIPFSVLLVRYFPRYGVAYHSWSGQKMWIGVCDQKNGLGMLASIAVFFLIWSISRRWHRPDRAGFRYQTLVDMLILIAALWLLKGPGSYSATAVVTLAAGLSCYIGLWLMKKIKIAMNPHISVVILALIIIYGTAVPFIGRLPAGDISSGLGRDSSLTGRSEIWADLVPAAMSRPILGHGFFSFSARKISKQYANSHNGYLEVILGLGFVGLFLVSVFVLSSFRKAQRELRFEYDWAVLWICWIIMVLLNNITESTLHSFSSVTMAVLMWLTISYNSRAGS